MKFLIVFLIASMIFFNSCSNGNVPVAICDYGSTVCDISQTVCREIPGLDPKICDYLDLACYNLDQLCKYPVDSREYRSAVISLDNIKSRLQTWSSEFKNKHK